MKVDITQIEQTLLERKVELLKIKEILNDLVQAAEEDKADKADTKTPTAKYQHVVILNDPDGKFKDEEMTAWVVVQQEGKDNATVLADLRDAAKYQNDGSKRKKNLITNMGELFQSLKPKFLKEKGIKIKTKEAVQVKIINGRVF